MPGNRGGVTLVDILIVVMIVAILAAIAIPRFAATKEKQYIADMKSDLRALAAAEDAFVSDSSHYARVLPPSRFHSLPGVTAPAIVTGDGWWTATVRDSMLPGTVCGIGVSAKNPVDSSAADGDPACK